MTNRPTDGGTWVRRMSETPTTTTSRKSIAIHLQFVLQYASNLYCHALGALRSEERKYDHLLPFVSQYASHLYCNTPPICIAVLLGKSWWLWSLGCSPLSVATLESDNLRTTLRRHDQTHCWGKGDQVYGFSRARQQALTYLVELLEGSFLRNQQKGDDQP